MRLAICVAVIWFVLLAGCGLFNKLAADSGNERANTPEARDLSMRADKATTDWLTYLLYGLLPAGYVAGSQHQKIRHKKAAKPA